MDVHVSCLSPEQYEKQIILFCQPLATQHCFNTVLTLTEAEDHQDGVGHTLTELYNSLWCGKHSKLGEDTPEVQSNSFILILPAELLINRRHIPNFPTFTQGKPLLFRPFDEAGYSTLNPSKQDIQFSPGHYIQAGESPRLLKL